MLGNNDFWRFERSFVFDREDLIPFNLPVIHGKGGTSNNQYVRATKRHDPRFSNPVQDFRVPQRPLNFVQPHQAFFKRTIHNTVPTQKFKVYPLSYFINYRYYSKQETTSVFVNPPQRTNERALSLKFQFLNRFTRFPLTNATHRYRGGSIGRHVDTKEDSPRGRWNKKGRKKEERKGRVKRESRIDGEPVRRNEEDVEQPRGRVCPGQGRRRRRRKNAFGLLDRVGGHVRRLGRPGGSPGHGLAGQASLLRTGRTPS